MCFPRKCYDAMQRILSETQTLQLHRVACALSPPAGPEVAADPRAWFRMTAARATEPEWIQTGAHKRKQSSLMNHLFGQDKNVSTLFPFIQKSGTFQIY